MSAKNNGTVLREVPVQDAIGLRLAHDLTQIVPGQFKGRLFKKGHIITEADIPKLLDIGKEHIYTMELGAGELHEDDAAGQMAESLYGEGMRLTEPHEGKVAIKSDLKVPALAVIDEAVVHAINNLGDIALATLRSHTVVMPDGQLAATRVIPLFVAEEKVGHVRSIADQYRQSSGGRGPLRLLPLRSFRIGLLSTGGEVFSGRIADKFGPAVRRIVESLGSEVAEQRFAPDDRHIIVKEIHYLLNQQYDMILVTGGMSVDPDDRTPAAIQEAGAEIVSYGTPMLPGSMLLVGYLNGVPIMGLPGCVMHDPYTSFNVLLPRVLAGEVITREDIVQLGYGGLHSC